MPKVVRTWINTNARKHMICRREYLLLATCHLPLATCYLLLATFRPWILFLLCYLTREDENTQNCNFVRCFMWVWTWSLTLREEIGLGCSRLGPTWDEVGGDWKNLHNKELHCLHSSPDTCVIRVTKSKRMTGVGHLHEVLMGLLGKSMEKRTLRRHMCTW